LNKTPALPTALLELLSAIDFQDSDYQNLELYHEVLNCLGSLYSSLREENMGPGHYLRVFSWPSLLRADSVMLAKQKCPVALVLLAYYLVFVKLFPDIPWTGGLANREIQVIAGVVGSRWSSTLEISMKAMRMTSREEIVTLMLG